MNVEKIEEYIRENLADATLEGLADKIGYSRFYIGPWVRSVMNMSFSQLLKKRRCEYAAKLLKETDLSVQEIIEMTGYKNESFFRKIFKDAYGSAPFEYRKKKTDI
ncbi:MAG: helix-turn-helix transcriptional regulator [Clostridia bacterium]|nr:helix-turn-helix transcriptional regulator [Clostridia bacterium]